MPTIKRPWAHFHSNNFSFVEQQTIIKRQFTRQTTKALLMDEKIQSHENTRIWHRRKVNQTMCIWLWCDTRICSCESSSMRQFLRSSNGRRLHNSKESRKFIVFGCTKKPIQSSRYEIRPLQIRSENQFIKVGDDKTVAGKSETEEKSWRKIETTNNKARSTEMLLIRKKWTRK